MSNWTNGLPPVGDYCEYRPARPFTGIWEEVRYHGLTGSGEAIIENKAGKARSVIVAQCDFRPLKSKAELKREKAVEEMIEDSKWTLEQKSSYPHYTVSGRISEQEAQILHDAGYRKVNELTDDDICRLLRYPHMYFSHGDFARAVEAHILGEES